MASIISAGMSKFGSDNRRLIDHIEEAAVPLMKKTEGFTVDFMVFSTPYSFPFNGLSAVSASFGSLFGLESVPYVSVDNTSATGSSAILVARSLIESSIAKHVLVIGGEKMTSVGTRTASRVIASLLPGEEASAGLTLPSVAAFTVREYIQKYSPQRESIARVAVKNHHNGSLNPLAHFQKEVTLERVISSRIIADPLRLFEFCPVSDGAAALLMTSDDDAESYSKNPVKIISVGSASDSAYLAMRETFTHLRSVQMAAFRAFEQTDVSRRDIDLMELHDMSSILEIVELEDLGFSPPGKGWEMAETGMTSLEGELPVNTSGGLISRGHPLGATGIAQAVEIFAQLGGNANKRQVKNHNTALSLNLAGYGNNATVILYGVS